MKKEIEFPKGAKSINFDLKNGIATAIYEEERFDKVIAELNEMKRPKNVIETKEYIEPYTFENDQEAILFYAYLEQEKYINELEKAINYTHYCNELKAFKDEFIEAWEDGSGGNSDLYRKAKSL